jgi:hypothetical protein
VKAKQNKTEESQGARGCGSSSKASTSKHKPLTEREGGKEGRKEKEKEKEKDS